MAVKSNRLKSELKEDSGKRIASEAKDSAPKSRFALPSFKPGERTQKIIGLFLGIFSLFLLLAMASFFYTGGNDYSIVKDSTWWDVITKKEIRDIIQNSGGFIGALLADLLIVKGFGIASFLLVYLLFIFAWRILFKSTFLGFNLGKTLAQSAFVIVFLPIFIAFLISFFNVGFFIQSLAGNFGVQINDWLIGIIGSAGTGLAIVLTGLTYAVIVFNIDFKLPEKKPTISEEDLLLAGGLEPTLENRPAEGFEVDEPNAAIEFPIDKQEATLSPEELQNTLPFLVESPAPIVEEPKEDLELLVEEVAEEKIVDEKSDDEKLAASLVKEFGEYDPTLELSSYKYPTLDLLENHGSGKISIQKEELEENKNKIVQTLRNYNIEIASIKATVGPTVTLYEIIPKEGTRISKIKNLEDDIALSLAALGIRIIAPIPGKGTIGIEVPNQNPEIVSMRSILASEKFQNSTMDLPLALGRNISNEVFIADLAKMPHLLMAGATGQGKSVGINALLVSLLYKKHPSQLKFVMVDPKKVELTLFRKIERHFLAKLPGEEEAIITDTKKVINTLNSLCIEMDQRYDLLKDAHVRNLKEYNQKFISRKLNPENGHRFLPFIVLVIDEFADLMMTAGKEVETPIARLAQLARAIGIHLVIATQRPSVNIITGTIKANFPARLAFRVSSKIDSRTILDSGGADQLIGRGDMLLSTGNDLIRLQCAFVDTPEAEKIVDFIGSQRGYADAHLLPEYVGEDGEGSSTKEFDSNEKDPMFEEAARLIVRHQQGSTSLIQRKLKLGYNRAGRIIDQLESAGIVGSFEGSKAREVKYPDEYSLEIYLTELNKK